jgi:hypothetical protein
LSQQSAAARPFNFPAGASQFFGPSEKEIPEPLVPRIGACNLLGSKRDHHQKFDTSPKLFASITHSRQKMTVR